MSNLTTKLAVSAFFAWVAGGPLGSQHAFGRIQWRNDGTRVSALDKGEPPRVDVLEAAVSRNAGRHVVVQFGEPVPPRQRRALAAAGLELLAYLGDNAFFASVSPGADGATVAQTGAARSVEPIQTAWKTHPMFAAGAPPTWAIVDDRDRDNPTVAAYVLFHPDVPLMPDGVVTVRRHGGAVVSRLRSINGLVIELPLSGIEALAGEDVVQWIEPPLPPLDSTNDSNRQVTQVDIVQSDPQYALNGSGVTVLVYDGGTADEGHPDLGGRVTARDDTQVNSHSTHVAGTIGGDGFASNGVWRGMAPAVRIESYGFETAGGLQEGFLYTDPGDIERDYDEAIHSFHVAIANNSIGTNVCANGFDCAWTGDYGVTSQLIDAIVVGSLGTPFRVIWAAGNERDCDRCRDEGVHTPEGYHSTAPPACAKNHITVGAVNSNDESMTPFSSWGPTDDGRLKPDLVAPGCQVGDDFGVTSSITLGGYFALCGTSMAAPTVTGAVALLLEDYHNRFPGEEDLRNSMLKALLTHNAFDLEQPGPDYRSGYGAIRIKEAIDFLRNGNFFDGRVDQQEGYARLIEVEPGVTALKVTLAWDDVPGTPNVRQALVNDLDLRVYDPSGRLHFPWTLDAYEPGRVAQRTRSDRLNNIEQVVAHPPDPETALEAGLWLVEVYGYHVPAGPQSFSVCASAGTPADCDQDGTPDHEQLAGAPELDCSGNGILDACEPDCDGDGIADSCELVDGGSTDCNRNGVPDDCEEWVDCNGNSAYDPCDVRDGQSDDCNRNWVPDGCEPDINRNGTPDECDIAEGRSRDWNRDGIPDEIQPYYDCNFNLIPDRREVIERLAEDFNGNSVPDECDLPDFDRTVYVDAANRPGPGHGTLLDPFCRIQDAIDYTLSGYEIIVMPGIYAGVGNRDLDFGGRRITLRSIDPGDPVTVTSTVIDCQAKGRGLYFHSGETPEAVLDGFTIRDGLAAVGSTPGAYRGGGIYCKNSSPTIRNCVITECMVGPDILYFHGGGGIYCWNSSPVIDNCAITANFAYNYGGGVYCYDGSSPLIRNCIIEDNVSLTGAGIACRYMGNVTFDNCIITDNTGGAEGVGGGIACHARGDVTIRSSMIFGNEGGVSGGAIYGTDGSDLLIHECTIAANDAYVAGGLSLAAGAGAVVTNSILWDNAGTVEHGQVLLEDSSWLAVGFSDLQGGAEAVQGGDALLWLDGNIDLDPSFAGGSGDDYRLTEHSPCIDRGDPQFVPGDGHTDIDGEARVQHCRIDMGADESPFFADCNSNTLPDACETAGGTSEDCDANAVPDECQDTSADCNGNGVWDRCDIADGSANDCNTNGVPDNCEVDSGTSEDCNENGVPDECDIAQGTSRDVNGNGIPDGCEPCETGEDCSDGRYCTGIEQCVNGVCMPGQDPCPGRVCVEGTQTCYDCLVDQDCDDGNECTRNTCEDWECHVRYVTGPCDDGEPCTENDVCVNGRCVGTVIPGCGVAYSLRAVEVNAEPISGTPADGVTVYPDDTVTCEIFLKRWQPRTLRGYNVTVDADSYTTGSRGFLAPLVVPNPAAGAFIDRTKPDFVFFGLPVLTAVWNAEPTFYQYVGLVLFSEDCAADPGAPAYLATLVITVSNDAAGTFTVCLDDTDADGDLDPEFSYLRGCDSWAIKPIDFECLTITVIPDCNHNGILDDEDIAEGTSDDCNHNGLPDECEPDCNENGVADSCDIIYGTSEDCNDNGVPDSCDVDEGTSPDCDGNAVPDECQPDCNENDAADVCDIIYGTSSDCNGNCVPDECDLAAGTSEDCDGNDLPDECQDTSDDCNGNGVWDPCDIADGTSGDCNDNGVPDDCDVEDGTSDDCDRDGIPDECPEPFPMVVDVSELDGVLGLIVHGIDEDDNSGRNVAGAGDVNADGIDDILINAPAADPGGGEEAGQIYVVFGRSGPWPNPLELRSLLPGYGGDGSIGFAVNGLYAEDFAGDGVSSAGDLNGDGIDDLVIGASWADADGREDAGQVYVLFGHPAIGAGGIVSLADLDGANGFTIHGAGEGDLTGRQVAPGGDINGDGIHDILVSAHLASVGDREFAGRVYVLFGRVDPWPEAVDLAALLPEQGGDGTTGFVINGIGRGDLAGSSLAGPGDVNDDGFDDVLLGAYAVDPNDLPYAGQAYVVFGGPTVGAGGGIELSDLNGHNGLTINGIDAQDLAGDSVAGAGDVNSDGIADLMIGAVWADPNGQGKAGETYVILGHSDPWPEVLELSTLLPENGGDGTVGFVVNGIHSYDLSGFTGCHAGDMNDDGIDDMIIGAYGASPCGVDMAGEAYILFGHPDPWPASFDLSSLPHQNPTNPVHGFVIRGADERGFFSQGVARAGDVNNDGITDVIIGAPNASPNGEEAAGKSYVIFGHHVFPRDCNGNGVLDRCDVLEGTSEDCNGDDILDECQDSGTDCNENGVWDLCDIIHGTSSDCNHNGSPDECDIAGGDSHDCNENNTPDECEPTYAEDCNNNGIWDACDVHSGTSSDCNANGIPDECEPGGSEDCNANGHPDLCDITCGTSQDINVNGIPDECEPHERIHVDANTCNQDTGGTGTEADPFCRIQDAIDSAGDGASAVVEVVVADGVYTGPGNTDLDVSRNLPEGQSRAVWIHNEHGPTRCAIDCAAQAGHAFSFHRGETAGARVEGFTIMGATWGAIECTNESNPTIRNCVITRNMRNGSGAGIKCVHSSPTISHCIIAGNYVNGICCKTDSNPTIVNCAIVGNHSGDGGGILCLDESSPVIKHCTIVRNLAAFEGGGIYNGFLSTPVVDNSIVWGNTPDEICGAARVTFSDVGGGWPGCGNMDVNPLFVGRLTGVWTADGQYDPETHQTTLLDAAASWPEGGLVGCTVNAATEFEIKLAFVIIANTATTLTVWGDLWGLADEGGAYEIFNYRLTVKSPCVNAGEFGLRLLPGETDVDGQERLQQCRVDMGACESHYLVDCNGNGLSDACEIVEGIAEDCDENGVPDECEPDCNHNAIADACDIMYGKSEDENANGIPDECEPPHCDLNGDGRVDTADAAIMRRCQREPEAGFDPLCEPADLNGDQQITVEDWYIFINCYRKYGSDDGVARSAYRAKRI